MKISSAKFVTSVAKVSNIPNDYKEFAFVGRSNVGKSSLINSLLSQKLARTSTTPGRTRLINFFLINNAFYFVDLPGYGFHSAGKQNENLWATLIENYLKYSKALERVFMLVDIRHTPTSQDKQMLYYLTYSGIPFTIIATKADKVAKSKVKNYIKKIADEFCITSASILPYSSIGQQGREEILNIIEQHLNL